MKILIIASVLAPLLSSAAGNPIREDSRLSRQTVEQAKSVNKPILVISPSNTGRSPNLLENRHISQFLSKHFVIEQAAPRQGSGDYAIYNERGELIHRVVDEKYPYELAAKIKRALDPNTQYYTLLARFERGDRSANMLQNLIIGASDADDRANVPRVMQAYLETLPAEPTEAAIRFISRHTKRSSEPGFAFLLDRSASVDQLAEIIFNETFVARLDDRKADATAIAAELKRSYPADALAPHIDRMPITFLEMREDWDGLREVLPLFVQTYGKQLSPKMLEYYAWLSDSYMVNK